MTATVVDQQSEPISDLNKRTNLLVSVPQHLEQVFWLDYEFDCATGLLKSLEKELARLVKHASVKKVHNARIALRRWNAAWKVLKQDGWEAAVYRKRMGKKLRRLRTSLGQLRDWDVDLQTAQMLRLPGTITNTWSKRRAQAAKQVHKELRKLKVKTLLKRLRQFLRKRHKKLQDGLKLTHSQKTSAYDHLERYLQSIEEASRKLDNEAHTANELHQLRLSIKHWRYFLTEFFGLTNLQLVQAQQLLGKFNDLQRILLLLEEDKNTKIKGVIAKIKGQQKEYLQEFETLRKSLPFGLRPAAMSLMH